MDHSKRRRKVIRRLDFENCEVTTVKVKKKFRKRLKAKITSEYEEEQCESPEFLTDHSGSVSDTSKQGSGTQEENSSPILFRKCSGQKRIPNTSSPVLLTKQTGKRSDLRKKRRILQDEDESQPSTSWCSGEGSARPTSPVFIVKSAVAKRKKVIANEVIALHKRADKQGDVTKNALLDDTPTENIRSQQPNGEITLSSDVRPGVGEQETLMDDDDRGGGGHGYEIEDFSQELSEETKGESAQEMKISSYSSESRAFSELVISQEQSRDGFSEIEGDEVKTPSKDDGEGDESTEASNSDMKMKRYKRDGLAVRLINLRRRNESERRIREHKSKIMKTGEKWKKTVCVAESWKDGTRLTLKCQQLDVAGDSLTVTAADENLYVVLDKDIGNIFNKISDGMFLRIAPPWQELRLRTLNSSVLLSVTSVELIDNIPGVAMPTTGMQKVPISKYKEDEASFFNTLLNSETDVFLR